MADLLRSKFEDLVHRVKDKQVNKQPTQTEKLKLYAWYKQATEGDVTGEAPSGFDIVGKAKHTAWSEIKGMSQEMAMQKYLDFFTGE